MRIALIGLALASVVAVAPALSAQPRAAAPACRIALPASADAASFTAAERSGGPASAQQTGTVFAAAAAHLCASGVVRPTHFARYRRLLVRNAEGAAEPNIYDDAEEQPGALIIEFAFADGPPPTQAAVEAALRCWRNPSGAGCSAEDMGP
jgi:ABC-type transport system substrate-binding protein